jgi:hypothetical protein
MHISSEISFVCVEKKKAKERAEDKGVLVQNFEKSGSNPLAASIVNLLDGDTGENKLENSFTC